MVADYEYSLAGLTFGGSTIWGVNHVDGLTEPPEPKEDLSDSPGRHGGFSYVDFYHPRRIVFEGDIVDSATFETSVQALKNAWTPSSLAIPLVLKRPTIQQQRIYVKPARLSIPYDTGYNISQASWTGELIAGDPHIYADGITSKGVFPGTPENASILGAFTTMFESVQIIGPGTGFRFRNASIPGDEIKVNTTLTAGQFMTLDFINRTVIRSDGTNLYGAIDQNVSRWWTLAPGTTIDMRFTVDSGSTGATVLTAIWRIAWM